MAKNEAKIKFTAETGELNKEINKSNQTLSELRAELRLNETQMKASGNAVEGLKNKHNILQSQLDASRSKTEALSQKVEKAIRIFGEDAEEVTKLKTQLANAQNEEAKLAQAVKECSDALEAQEKHTEAVNDSFAKMGDTMSDLASGGFLAVAGAIGAAGVAAGTTANDIDKATNTFIAKTGESADSAEEFEDAMTSIYNGNYGESFDDISESMATVKTALGDIGTDELEKVTTDALILRDTFDMDVNESIRAVNSMMDQFGITADEAYSLIAQGAQNGLNQNDDLLDTVNEYSVQFKNAGYSAEDMFNMLANGVDAGTWSVDKLGDAVKEFNIRASDGTVGETIKDNAKAFGLTREEAKSLAAEVETGSVGSYQKLAETLRSVDDDTKRYQLGVELFGTMWEDLGEEAVLAMLDTKGEISTTKDALDEINAVKYDDLGSALQGIGRNLQTSLAEPIKNEVMPAVNEFIADVDWQGVGQTIGEAFGVVVEGAMALANAVKEAVQWMNEHKAVMAGVAIAVGIVATAITAYNAVQAVKTAMDAAQVTTVWALVSAHIAQAAAAMAAIAPYILIVAAIAAVIAIIVLLIKNWDKVAEACKKAWEAVKKTLSQWGKWINSNVIQPVKNFFSNLWTAVKTAASNAWNGIKSVWSAVKGWFSSTIIQPVGNFFSNLWSKITSAASNAWNSVKSKASSAFNSVKSIVTSVKSTFTSILDSIKSKFTSVFDSAKSIVQNAIQKIKGFFNFNWSLPKIKLPHFSITGKFSLNPPSIPKFSVEWYKDGGIFTKPTIFGTPYGFKGVGEAGAEAVLPIDRLEGYISGAIEKAQNSVNLNALAAAIEDLANRPVALNINGRQFALATAGDGDSVNGLRSTFKSRGLVLD